MKKSIAFITAGLFTLLLSTGAAFADSRENPAKNGSYGGQQSSMHASNDHSYNDAARWSDKDEEHDNNKDKEKNPNPNRNHNNKHKCVSPY